MVAVHALRRERQLCIRGSPETLEDARLSLLTARSFVGDRAKRIAEHCVQMHGGIAFTWDYGLHRHLKRINYRRSTIVKSRYGRQELAQALLDSCLVYTPPSPRD